MTRRDFVIRAMATAVCVIVPEIALSENEAWKLANPALLDLPCTGRFYMTRDIAADKWQIWR